MVTLYTSAATGRGEQRNHDYHRRGERHAQTGLPQRRASFLLSKSSFCADCHQRRPYRPHHRKRSGLQRIEITDGGSIRKCPKCRSENITIEVTEVKEKRRKGWAYWIFIGWWWEIISRSCSGLEASRECHLWQKNEGRFHHALRRGHQNCGNRWNVK